MPGSSREDGSASTRDGERLAAADTPAQVVLSALARAGLHDFDGEDHQAVQHPARLDDALCTGSPAGWSAPAPPRCVRSRRGRPTVSAYTGWVSDQRRSAERARLSGSAGAFSQRVVARR